MMHRDPWDARRVRAVTGLLDAFHSAGVIDAGDVHFAQRVAAVVGETDERVILAAAFALRAPRYGHVCVDLSQVRDTVAVDAWMSVDLDRLPWPDVAAWIASLTRSPLVGYAPDQDNRILRGDGYRLYLNRLWRDEIVLADALRARAATILDTPDTSAVDAGLDRLFGPDGDPLQRHAAATVVRRGLTILCGGPGTGKTTTVARALALAVEQAQRQGQTHPRIAMAAPTGKAADRLAESVSSQIAEMDVDDATRVLLADAGHMTVHRLLGARGGPSGGFVHGPDAPLPYDIVVVDEASMMDLSLAARLCGALDPRARLVLVGDPGQLASVEAGSVLGDLVGGLDRDHDGSPLDQSIVALERVFRFDTTIADLAAAVRRGDADAAIDQLRAGHAGIHWITDADADLRLVRAAIIAGQRSVFTSAQAGDGAGAIAAANAVRLLCAHRHGPFGVDQWTARIEQWCAEAIEGYSTASEWYLGRTIMVTRSDEALGVFNGDVGVVVRGEDDRPYVACTRAGQVHLISPDRLAHVDAMQAVTIHKSQGSEFATVIVVVPEAPSRLLSRELLYTAMTRTRDTLMLIGTEAAIRAAIARPIERASGLGERVWSSGDR
jgi:exodeoxyribonuclease V alpha subunit